MRRRPRYLIRIVTYRACGIGYNACVSHCIRRRKRGNVMAGHWLSAEKESIVLASYGAGNSSVVAAQQAGCHESTARKILRRHGVPFRGAAFANRKHALDASYFRDVDTEAKAYWLGFLTADGYVTKNGYTVGVELAQKDSGHLEKLRVAVGSTAPVRDYYKSAHGVWQSRLSLYSREVVADLARHGVTHGCPSRTPPALPADIERHYFRGLFDGDGGFGRTVVRKGFIQWSMVQVGNLACVEAFAAFCRRHVPTVARITDRGNIHAFILSGTRFCKAVAAALYEGASVVLDRKVEVYRQLQAAPVLHRKRDLTIGGVTRPAKEWAKEEGAGHYKTIVARLDKGYSHAEAVFGRR